MRLLCGSTEGLALRTHTDRQHIGRREPRYGQYILLLRHPLFHIRHYSLYRFLETSDEVLEAQLGKEARRISSSSILPDSSDGEVEASCARLLENPMLNGIVAFARTTCGDCARIGCSVCATEPT